MAAAANTERRRCLDAADCAELLLSCHLLSLPSFSLPLLPNSPTTVSVVAAATDEGPDSSLASSSFKLRGRSARPVTVPGPKGVKTFAPKVAMASRLRYARAGVGSSSVAIARELVEEGVVEDSGNTEADDDDACCGGFRLILGTRRGCHGYSLTTIAASLVRTASTTPAPNNVLITEPTLTSKEALTQADWVGVDFVALILSTSLPPLFSSSAPNPSSLLARSTSATVVLFLRSHPATDASSKRTNCSKVPNTWDDDPPNPPAAAGSFPPPPSPKYEHSLLHLRTVSLASCPNTERDGSARVKKVASSAWKTWCSSANTPPVSSSPALSRHSSSSVETRAAFFFFPAAPFRRISANMSAMPPPPPLAGAAARGISAALPPLSLRLVSIRTAFFAGAALFFLFRISARKFPRSFVETGMARAVVTPGGDGMRFGALPSCAVSAEREREAEESPVPPTLVLPLLRVFAFGGGGGGGL
mmetsp:Transcript_20528/g.42074  ORF Transcript_20528/g.42074 Transcript_20528/m.42074 type:complete len:476 (+) Transcript_20528:712-2139(+)